MRNDQAERPICAIAESEIRGPKKGASRKWAQRLQELGRQAPPSELLEKINKKDKERIAAVEVPKSDVDLEP